MIAKRPSSRMWYVEFEILEFRLEMKVVSFSGRGSYVRFRPRNGLPKEEKPCLFNDELAG